MPALVIVDEYSFDACVRSGGVFMQAPFCRTARRSAAAIPRIFDPYRRFGASPVHLATRIRAAARHWTGLAAIFHRFAGYLPFFIWHTACIEWKRPLHHANSRKNFRVF